MLRHDAPLELHHIDILLPVDEDAVTPRGGGGWGHFLGQVGFLASLHSVFAETLAPALSPGGFADKAGVRYAGGASAPRPCTHMFWITPDEVPSSAAH